MASRTLKLSLLADTEKFGKGVDKAETKLGKLGGAAKKAGKLLAVGVGAAASLGAGAFAMANKVSKGHDKIAKSASKMGVTTDLYQELDYWAGQNGISSDQMERAVGRLTQRMGRAGEGNEKYLQSFERLGVSIRDGNGEMRDTSAVLPEVIAKLSAIEDPATRSAVAGELLGTKMARELMPALEDGALSLDDAAAKARELGHVVGGEAIDSSVKFQDNLDNLKKAAGGLLQKGMTPLIGFLADKALPFVTDTLLPGLEKFRDWIGPKLTTAASGVSAFFRDTVMPTLAKLREWFVDKVLPAAAKLYTWFTGTLVPGIRATVVPIIDGLRSALESIRARFDGNGESAKRLWNNVLKPLVQFIVTKVAPVVGQVLGGALKVLGEIIGTVIDVVLALVDGIGRVVEWFGKATKEGGSLRRAFDVMAAPIRTVRDLIDRVRSAIDRVLGPLRKFTDAAGGAMSAAKNVGSSITSGVKSAIPGLATGGVVTAPTLAMVGEGREAEAVLPLSKLQQLLDGDGRGPTINVTGTMMDPEGVARAVERALRDSQRRTGGRAVAS